MTTQLSDGNKRPLPDGWKWTTIGKITNPERIRVSPQDHPDLPYIGMDDVESETMRLLGTKSSSEMKSTSEYFKPDDVLYGRLRPYLNKVYRPDFEGLCSAEFIIFRKSPHLNSKYLQYFLNQWSFVSFINMKNTGDRPRVKFSQMADYPFPLPPLPVQERIVAEIEKQFTRLDTAVSTLNRLQSNLNRYQASLLKAACTGQLLPQDANDEPAERLLQRILVERRQRWLETEWQNQVERAQKKAAQAQRKAAGRPHHIRDLDPADWQSIPEAEYAPYLPKNDKWEKKYKEPAAVETAVLPDLPPGWVWASLDQLLSGIEAGKSPQTKNKPIEPGQVGVIKVSAMSWGEFLPEENKALLDNHKPDNMPSIQAGDLLLSRANTVELVGAVVLVKKDYPNLLLSDKSLRLVPASDFVLRQYLLFALRTQWVRDVFERQATGTSDSMRNLSQTKILTAPIALPPLAEQKRIVEEVERRLSIVTATQQAIRANQTRSGRLRQSILQQAFNGQLVPQSMEACLDV